jgi:hypothetical protein
MSSAHHIIRRYTFDVQFGAKEKAAALQDDISMLFRRRLADDMEQLLQQLLPDNVVAVLPTLELDLGTIGYKEMESQLPLKLLEALEKALTGILRSGTPGTEHILSGNAVVKTGSERLCELLEYYLLTGTLPWWATAEEREQPDLAILQLTELDAPRLATLLRRLGQQEYIRKRIAWQFSISAIRKMVSLLQPAEAAFIFEYAREILLVQQQRQVLQTESKALERAVWLFVLTYLLTEGGSNFSRKQFVRSHLTQMAHHFNVDYETLLQLFHDALVFYKQDLRAYTIGGFIKSLYGETAASRKTHTQYMTAGAPASHLAALRYYLQFGSFPWWGQPMSLTELYGSLLTTAQKTPAPFREMLMAMLQQAPAWERWATLFDPAQREHLLRQLNDQYLLRASETFMARPAAQAPADLAGAEQVLLQDVLLYRLVYGSIPWWGRTYAHFSLNSLFEQLLERAAATAVMVFKYAGTLSYTMERLLAEIRPALFFSISRAAGITEQACDAYDQVYALLQAVQRYIISGLNVSVFQPQVMKAFWQTWALGGYRHFQPGDFTDAAVAAWAELTGVTAGSLFFLMKSALKEEGNSTWLSAHIQQRVITWETEAAASYYTFRSAWAPGTVHVPHPLVYFVRNSRAPDTPAEKELTGKTLSRWLRHFLEEGQLPAQAGVFTSAETTWLAARILEWLYVNYRERLTDVAALIQPLPLILNRLFSLWQVMGATPVPARELLASWMERMLAAPGSGDMVVVDGLWQVLPEQPESSAKELRPALPAAVSRLLHRFRQYDAITSAVEKQQWLEEAIRLLQHFLVTAQLPGDLPAISGAVTTELLKQAVILVFREKPALLNTLFSDIKGTLSARLQVYHLFMPPAGLLEERIRQSLDVYAIQDSLLLLQQTAARSPEGAVAGFRDAVRFYKQQGRQERHAFYRNIFRYPVLVQYAAQQLDDEDFLYMMEDIEIGWGHPATAALRELQRLFDLMVADSREREKIRILFRQFHIMLLAGHFTLHNAAAYAGRFLEFLVNTGAGLVRNLIVRLAGANETTDLSSYGHLRNILPALQHTAAKYVQLQLHEDRLKNRLYEDGLQLLYPQQQPAAPPVIKPLPVKDAQAELPVPAPPDYSKLKKPEPETIYVNNAGLVLLSPFLTTAFQRMGWLQAGQFIHREAQIRAIHFLQYTVNLREVHAEHELVLNKVLCNFPLEEPVPAELALTEAEKQLSHQLLQVVLQQWEKMSKTSVEGFRGAFLMREGALWETEEAWYLRVEQRGYDVILQSLPWGIAMVKTSWMNKMLYTEWVYK